MPARTARAARDRIALDRQLLEAQKIEALRRLAGGIAHDINNCLVPILSLSTLALETLPADRPERSGIELIRDAGDRISDLVARMLLFSRCEQSVTVPVDLNQIFAEVVKSLRPTLPAAIDLRFRANPAQAIIEGDDGQLRQILPHLCANAADAIGRRSGGVIEILLDETDIEDRLDTIGGKIVPGRYHRLRVADNGRGMDAATVARICEPFYTTKVRSEGAGLGLAMVYSIVQSHSGNLRVSSRSGAGTTVEVYLPASGRTFGECSLARPGDSTLPANKAYYRKLSRKTSKI